MTSTIVIPTVNPELAAIGSRRSPLSVRGRQEIVLTLLIGIGSFVPMLIEFLLNLNSRPHYHFFPFVLLTAGWLAWQRAHDFTDFRAGYSRFSIACLTVACLGLVAATLIDSPWTAYLSLLVCMTGFAHAWGGWPLFRRLLPIGLLLATLLPPPLQLDARLIQSLQRFATLAGSQILDGLQVPHLVSGSTLVVRSKHLLVEEACSGIHSLTSVLAVTLIFLIHQRRHWLPSLLVLGLAVVWVLAANVVRIVAIALAEDWYHKDISAGFIHYLLGTALFMICIALVVSSDCLFRMFARPQSTEMPNSIRRNSTANWSGRFVTLRRALAGLGLACLLLGGFRLAVEILRTPATHEYPLAFADSLLPLRSGIWARGPGGPANTARTSSSSFGDYSSAWTWRAERWTATASIDYAFPVWHDLTVCYRANGWNIRDEQTRTGEVGVYKVIDLQHPELGDARLYYTMTDAAGQAPPLPDESFGASFAQRFAHSMMPAPRVDYFQVQLLLHGSATAIAPAVDAQAQTLFFEAVNAVRAKLPHLTGEQP